MNTARSECPAPRGPHLRPFATCGVLVPPLDKYAIVTNAPTRANVAYRPASPPAVGTWRVLGKTTGPREQLPSYTQFVLLVRLFITSMPVRSNVRCR